jgi:hypothetical protein
MKQFALALVLAVCACGGDDTSMQAQPDATPEAACTGALYDLCVTNDDCMSGNCRFFGTSNYSACITTCTAGDDTTCPVDKTGNHATCNDKGNCKPAAPNNCHL